MSCGICVTLGATCCELECVYLRFIVELHRTGVPAWREVVRMEKRDTSLIELKYRTLSPPKDGFEASLVAVVNNVTVVAVTSFLLVRHTMAHTLPCADRPQKIQTILTSILDSIHPTVLPLPSFGSASVNANKHCTLPHLPRATLLIAR